jgi:hypothetical protein
VGTDKFSISIPPKHAADSFEWLRKNIRAMAAMPRFHDEPDRRRDPMVWRELKKEKR